MKAVATALAGLLVLVLFNGAGVSAQSAPKSTIIQKVIVKVNGEIFTQTELEFRQIQTLKETNKSVSNAQDLNTDPGLIAALRPITPGILVDAVDELLLVQHGREIGVKFTEDRFQDALAQLKKANNIKDEAQFQEALKGEGITMAQLRVNVEHAYFVQTVQQRELLKNMTLTEEEARQYYNTHQGEFMTPATVVVREIVVNVPTSTVSGQAAISVGADEDAKTKITAVRDRALKGEDFAKLVTEVSDAPTKSTGGLIGPVVIDDLNPSLAAIIQKLKPGEISEPIRLRAGYQILKLESRSGAEPEPFDKSRDAIQQKILEGRIDVERNKFIQKLLTQAVIEWKDDNFKKMYDVERAARLKNGAATPGR